VKARSALWRAIEAADALDAVLHRPGPAADAAQGSARDAGRPDEETSVNANRAVSSVTLQDPPSPSALAVNRRDPETTIDQGGAPLCLAHTDWLYHRLDIAGPAGEVAAFRQAACGAGTVPWHLDGERMAEDWVLLLAASGRPALSLTGARVLAGQLRDAVERRHALAVARVGHSRACPLDLHALAPVPDAVLRLGPDHPDALAWLWQHWGTTEPLRHVVMERAGEDRTRDGLRPGDGRLTLSFWAADWTPWRAFARLRDGWPALRFDIRPRYDRA